MIQDEIIRMAREAGLPPSGGIVKFAALVAAHEREKCAVLCEGIGKEAEDSQPNKYFDVVAENCTDAIRSMK